MFVSFCLCRYIVIKLLRLPICLTIKSEENVSQINHSESLNFESLKYNLPDNNEVILLYKACDPDSYFYNAKVQKSPPKCFLA